MRIVSGTLRGRRIIAPNKLPARPTTDFAKESLFNILHHEISWPTTTVIDLFAGIGSITLEALSRGAECVWSIDSHAPTVRWLSGITKELRLEDRSRIVRGDALKWFRSYTGKAGLVFADPPYDFAYYAELIDAVTSHSTFNQGLFVLEHRKGLSFSEHPNFADQRTYGEVSFTFFRP
ncbi:MAG: RsmD family RNA methyltransferase [Cryomorphaceae bacterium]